MSPQTQTATVWMVSLLFFSSSLALPETRPKPSVPTFRPESLPVTPPLHVPPTPPSEAQERMKIPPPTTKPALTEDPFTLWKGLNNRQRSRFLDILKRVEKEAEPPKKKDLMGPTFYSNRRSEANSDDAASNNDGSQDNPELMKLRLRKLSDVQVEKLKSHFGESNVGAPSVSPPN